MDDVARAKEFYGSVLGLEVADAALGVGGADVPTGLEIRLGPGTRIMVYPKPDHMPATFTILNFLVDDIEGAIDELTARGVRFEHYETPKTTPRASIARPKCARWPGFGTRPATSCRSSRSEPTALGGRGEPMGDALTRLGGQLRGELLLPGDHGYDDARHGYNRLHDRRPAVVIRPADSDDIARALELATSTGLEVAARSGGHSLAGYGTTEGGVLIDLSAMHAIHLDPEARVAWVDAGTTAGQLTAATAAHGLVVPFGDSPDVGVGGITGTVAAAVSSREQADCRHEPLPSPLRRCRTLCVRWLLLPTRGDRAGGALVPARRPVVSRRGGAARRTRHRG